MWRISARFILGTFSHRVFHFSLNSRRVKLEARAIALLHAQISFIFSRLSSCKFSLRVSQWAGEATLFNFSCPTSRLAPSAATVYYSLSPPFFPHRHPAILRALFCFESCFRVCSFQSSHRRLWVVEKRAAREKKGGAGKWVKCL